MPYFAQKVGFMAQNEPEMADLGIKSPKFARKVPKMRDFERSKAFKKCF